MTIRAGEQPRYAGNSPYDSHSGLDSRGGGLSCTDAAFSAAAGVGLVIAAPASPSQGELGWRDDRDTVRFALISNGKDPIFFIIWRPSVRDATPIIRKEITRRSLSLSY